MDIKALTRDQLVLGALLVVVIIAFAYLSFIHPKYSRLIQLKVADIVAPLPDDIKESTLLLSSENIGGIYSQNSLDYYYYTEKNLAVFDAAKSNGHTAVIGVNVETNYFEVYLDDVLIASSPEQKARLQLSPEGNRVLYSENPSIILETPADDQWRVVVADGTTLTELGQGYAGLLLDDYRALLVDGETIVGFDFALNESMGSVPLRLESNDFSLVLSKNQSQIALYEENVAVIFDILGTQPLIIEPTRLITSVPGRLALTETALYVVTETELQQYPLTGEESTVLRMFKGKTAFTKLIP